MALQRFRDICESDDISEIFDIVKYFNFSSIESLPVKIKAEILALGSLVGGIESYWKGYSITYMMLATFTNLCKAQSLDLPVGINLQIIANAIMESLRSPESAKEVLMSIQGANSRERESIENLNSQLTKAHVGCAKELGRNRMKLIGGNLPANNANKKIPTSIFTRKAIQGSMFQLGAYALGLDEALMWAKVNPFSPLNDGALINPY